MFNCYDTIANICLYVLVDKLGLLVKFGHMVFGLPVFIYSVIRFRSNELDSFFRSFVVLNFMFLSFHALSCSTKQNECSAQKSNF